MITRRQFIQATAALPSTLFWGEANAANPDPSRLALVIGNAAYRDVPLTNPANDARAVSGLFKEAGFTVASHINATQAEMLTAVDKFAQDVSSSDAKLVVLYYAGHGVQLDWRNYLLPVDAAVKTSDQLRQSCIDLNQLIGKLGKSKDKTFIIVMDACRDNPFGANYRPEQKGLSQFDAPVGSLLAYATSPGNVASDGSGQNGLYTENLVKELSVRGVKIEDALKRVRLNVRLASKGQQIPWETTSLENDIYIFNEGKVKVSEREQEKIIEADVAEWGAIQESQKIEDVAAYLRKYPNGRFAEAAQARLTRLQAPVLSVAATPTPNTPPTAGDAPVSQTQQLIEIAVGKPIPQVFERSQNPYSVGRYPLGRIFNLGDMVTYRVSDVLTNVESQPQILIVSHINKQSERVVINDGEFSLDFMGNRIFANNLPAQFAPAELQIGNVWAGTWGAKTHFGFTTYDATFRIVALEKVRLPAGEMDAFKVEGRGWWYRPQDGVSGSLQVNIWLTPGLNFFVKQENFSRNKFGKLVNNAFRYELTALRQAGMDTRCTAPSQEQKRTLVIQSSCT